MTDPNCPPRELAALSRRLQELMKDIALIDARVKQETAEGAGLKGDSTVGSRGYLTAAGRQRRAGTKQR